MIRIILFSAVIIGLSGCLSSLTGDSYSREEARTIQQVQYATVEGIRPIIIEGTKTPVGVLLGGGLGGLGGRSVGGGLGKTAATVVGAAAGAAAGAALEEAYTRRQGDEITLRLESGKVISLVQERSPRIHFNVGDRVRILRNNGVIRVAP
jgi:outer membrane lipoprotein SlyB